VGTGKKILIAAPFAFFIGIFNPCWTAGHGPSRSPGHFRRLVSFASIMLRFVLTVSAALILIAVTGFHQVCAALERLGCPGSSLSSCCFSTAIFSCWGAKPPGWCGLGRCAPLMAAAGLWAYSSMLGHLLLRTLDRAQRLHLAMLSRGFDGEIRLLRPLRSTAGMWVFSGLGNSVRAAQTL